RWETEPKPIEGYAEFEVVNLGFSPRERSYQLDTLCTGADQLVEAAQIQGARLVGRAQGAYLEIGLSDAFFDRPEPLQTIAVVETEIFSSGTRRNLVLYQIDGLGFYLDGTESKVLMNLIWLGTTEGPLIPHVEPSVIPNFQSNLIRPPYVGLTLNQSNQSVPSTSPELVILTPQRLTLYSDLGLGMGLESSIAPVTTAIAQTVHLGLGIGFFGVVNNPVVGEMGVGVGFDATLQRGDTIASLGVGLGIELATESIETLQIGIGVGVDASLLGVWASDLGMGIGLQSSAVDDAIAQIGIGIGATTDSNQPIIGDLGIGTGFQSSAVDDAIAQVGIGLGAEAEIAFELLSQMGVGVGMDAVLPSSFEPETDTLLAALSGTYDSTRRSAMNALIAGLKTNNLWSTLVVLKLYAADVQGDALVNWKTPGTFNSTIIGSPTFTRDRGFGGFSTSNYLSSGFTPSTAGSVYTQNSATFGIYNTGQGTSDQTDAGVQNNTATTTATRLLSRNSNNAATSRINAISDGPSSVSGSATAGVYTSVGLTTVSRTASNAS
ncbi:MAG: hypothetical protein EBS38_08380, partial [Actinobacteria bacterium]|nr:hypothetical protein [Actinomycetota bacterium]